MALLGFLGLPNQIRGLSEHLKFYHYYLMVLNKVHNYYSYYSSLTQGLVKLMNCIETRCVWCVAWC